MGRRYRSLEKRLRLYEMALKLRRMGLKYRQISRRILEITGEKVNPGQICNWVNGKYNPLGRCNVIKEGPWLAYVIGAFLGDGSLNCHDRHADNYKNDICLSVKDYEFAAEFGRCLAKSLGRDEPYRPFLNEGTWVVKGCSVILSQLLTRGRDNPWMLTPYIEKYPAEVCRGFFDAEGSVNVKCYLVSACNTNLEFIEFFKTILDMVGIATKVYEVRQKELFKDYATGKTYKRKSDKVYHLTILGKENIVKFAKEIGFTITKKKQKLNKLLSKYKKY